VRHGHGPERSIQTGIGALDMRRPKVRDRAANVADEKRIRFPSAILPKWARRYVYIWADGVYLQARVERAAPSACCSFSGPPMEQPLTIGLDPARPTENTTSSSNPDGPRWCANMR
jgi:hypothetical protein